MAYKGLLVYFGWFVVILSLAMILIPYIRRTHDLMSTWSLFMVSCANFIGISAIQAGNTSMHIYVQPNDDDYIKLVVGGVLFMLSAGVTYFFVNWPERIAARTLNNWGSRQPKVLMSLIPICALLVLGYVFVPDIQMLGQWLVFFGRYASTFAAVFLLCCWSMRPTNVIYPLGAITTLAIALLVSKLDFGRRDLLSVMTCAPLAWYWLRGRYRSPGSVLAILSVFGFLGLFVLTGVSVTRHMKENPDLSPLQVAYSRIAAIPSAFTESGDTESLFGGDAVEASLATIHLYAHEPTRPFFTLEYIAAMPIPRAWWPTKPEGLGSTLPIDIGYVQAHGAVNFGPGVIGHGWHEGGIPMHIFYGFFYACVFRFWDGRMRRDPSNPYILGIFAACSGQVLAFSRGDIGLFSVLILGAFITGELISFIARTLFGTEHLPPMTAALPPMVQEASPGFPMAMSADHPF